ncbi:DUF6575 domain-containing protein [Candidatus Palauibacter sp.]|uniref:DUF6575 domain-containing protein n=1 Tax=Candidatus Palauibacter sp. TaxID=3101350 RepID=UPI003AF2941B
MTTITHVSTLFDYDGPQLFEARDAAGNPYLGLLVPSPEANEERCLVVAVTASRLRGFRDGHIDLRSAILDAAKDVWYLARGCPDLGHGVEIEAQPAPLSGGDLLPDESFFLPNAPVELPGEEPTVRP